MRRDTHWSKGGLVSLAVKHGHLEIVRLLLDLGADADERIILHELEEPTPSWGAPLWYAALAGRRDIAELLLDRGADPNANVYASGWPLRNAYQRNDEALKRLLVERGAKAQPYMVAEADDVAEARRMLEMDASEDLAQELVWSAADQRVPSDRRVGAAPPELACAGPALALDSDPADSGLGDNSGLRPAATTEDRMTCMAILLRHGIDANVSRLGQTVLHFAAARGGDREKRRSAPASPQCCMDAGARLDLRDDLLKSTPLGWACRWGRKELVELLIARGAPVNEPDAEPWATPLAWAKKMGHTDIERRLRDHGAKA